MKNSKPKNWVYKEPSKALVSEIAGELGISEPVAAVLVNRGIDTPQKARDFLFPQTDAFANPFLLPDMDAAVKRIRRAVDTGEQILVYGDRDVDGVASISVMVRTLESLGSKPLWYIPSDEGYGVHNEVLSRYASQGVKLVITVDCGISAAEEVKHGTTLGMDFVITDHHEPKAPELPKAEAIVNPKISGSDYPFSDLAGCFVSLKVAEALMLSFGRHYGKELVCAAVRELPGNKFEIGAAKTVNGIVKEEKIFVMDGRESSEELREFIGNGRVVVDSSGKTWFVPSKNEIIDLAVICALNPESGKAFGPIAAEIGLCAAPGGDILKAARFLGEAFWKLEKINDLRMKFFRENHLDVVALGTIADIMPLVDENRVVVKHGLGKLLDSKKVGLQALMQRCLGRGKSEKLSAKSISWGITPLLNAAGRRGKANISAELLLTEDEYRAHKLIDEITKLNDERRELQAENMEKFIPLLEKQCDIENDRIFVVVAEGVEHGVTGIIASQISRQYHRPTVLLIIEDGQAMGAARSIKGFDIVSCFEKVQDLLVKFGGHSQAAGLTVALDKLEEFRKRIKELAAKEISDELLDSSIEIDSELDTYGPSMKLYNELAELEPFGMGNPYPVFSMNNMKIIERTRLGANGTHLKLRLSKNGGPALGAVGWGLGHLDEALAAHDAVDLAFQMEVNNWQDRKTLQLLIVDIKPSLA